MTHEIVSELEPDELTYSLDDVESPRVIGGVMGPTKNHPDGELTNKNGATLYLREPRHTQYVLILHHGDLTVQPYDTKIHGRWQDIPKVGGTIPEFIDAIEGMGETEITVGEQFRKVRHTKSAMHTFDDTEKRVRQRGGDPTHIILFPAESFALDHSRLTIKRIRKDGSVSPHAA